MSTHWLAQLAEFRSNRDDADVTLNCQGEVVKAHSFILGIRYVCSTMVIKIANSPQTPTTAFIFFAGLSTSRRP